MAYTSVIPVHRLDNAIDYALDEKKSSRAENRESLEGEIDKALNKDQSEQDLFQSAIGCTIDSAFEDMCQIKKYGIRKKVCRDSIWCRVLLPEKSLRNWRIKSEWNLRIGCSAGNFRRWSVPISTPNASTTILCGTLFPWKREKVPQQ